MPVTAAVIREQRRHDWLLQLEEPKSLMDVLFKPIGFLLSITEAIIRPGLEPGAVDVVLEFICYYGGPLPEDLLPQFKCPVLVAWGEKDPWDPIKLGRAYGNFDAAPQVSPLSNEDEKPEMVNPLIESVVARHSKSNTALAPGI
ncbi:unnamed protein product [Brassica oleracea var. botrytis]|uniref:(rape) hypothetical protein n=1 Tax=Brassica napus TaxID=3708 RepID=A0A816JT35_BRANA|nr:unnamed protein product [Brassica napus]